MTAGSAIVCVFDRSDTHSNVDLFDYGTSGPVADSVPVALWSGTLSAESQVWMLINV